MREHMGLHGGGTEQSRKRKRMIVVLCAIANLAITFYVLTALLAAPGVQPPLSESSSSIVDCSISWSPFGLQVQNLAALQEVSRKRANDARRQILPLELIRRVKEIEVEAALNTPSKTPADLEQKSEQEELQDQNEIESGEQQGEPAVEDDEVGAIERLLSPVCHPEPGTDFGGTAVRWGLTNHVNSAAECCRSCLWQAATAKAGQLRCNVWVFCPENGGCASPDAYQHKFGECWLKQADQPQATVGNYPLKPGSTSTPLPVLWLSGVITANDG